MFVHLGGFAIDADIYCESSIFGDIWCEFGSVLGLANEAAETARITDYYLRQMNFLGNLVNP